ncbi:hypothetical protein GT725_21550, partial [Blautia wexlerae]|nr:hypothetical protein [Blautia wexlerae]MZT35761.1 hypothetical protein [Blautia wexlerae]MZT41557.1 hypothetical protein [Blautia wexlerae]MZT47748.1 hypothetical protein [Blautia wexlerae]MZT51926.1 hypothetical protein [Blautia wexlerae]
MFAKNSKAYSVYLLFRFVSSLAVSMSTVLSIVYHLEVVQLDVLWSSIFVTLMANKIGGLQFGIYRNC